MVNNYYKPGPATPAELKFVHASYQKENSKGTGQWYAEGNIMEGDKALTNKNKRGIDLSEAGFPPGAIAESPFAIAQALPPQSAKEAYEQVLKQAGAVYPRRDAVDARVVEETKTGTASGKGVFGKPGIIDLPAAVGGWPVYAAGIAPADTDADGMPDEWEIKKGLNPRDASDRNKTEKSGYTMLEIYLNDLVALHS